MSIDQSDMCMTDGITEDVYQIPLLRSVAAALSSQAESRRVAVELPARAYRR